MSIILQFIPKDTFFTVGSKEFDMVVDVLKNIDEFKRRGGMFASKVKLSGDKAYYIVNGVLNKVVLGGASNEDTRPTTN
jgi:hypothetical protein